MKTEMQVSQDVTRQSFMTRSDGWGISFRALVCSCGWLVFAPAVVVTCTRGVFNPSRYRSFGIGVVQSTHQTGFSRRKSHFSGRLKSLRVFRNCSKGQCRSEAVPRKMVCEIRPLHGARIAWPGAARLRAACHRGALDRANP